MHVLSTPTKAKELISDANFHQAINLWFSDCTECIDIFGHIGDWDTSRVADMTSAFKRRKSFNEDISRWDVSNVKIMRQTFNGATAFNADISAWDVSNVVFMFHTFNNATSFNQDISRWDVSNVRCLRGAFQGTTTFNQDLSRWDVSSDTKLYGGLFFLSAVHDTLQRAMQVSSFFDPPYLTMSPEERQQAFAGVFPLPLWQSRRFFVMFLASNGYLYSPSVADQYQRQAAKPSSEMVPCDAVFDVEDLAKYICQFL
jgi:surface protein